MKLTSPAFKPGDFLPRHSAKEHGNISPPLKFVDVPDEAQSLALIKNAKGPFNLAAEPVLDPEVLGRALGKPVVNVPTVVLRRLFALAYHLRLQPAEPGWLSLMLNVPIMSSERARRELGWSPAHSSIAALGELLTGLRLGAGGPTLPLAPARSREARLQH